MGWRNMADRGRTNERTQSRSCHFSLRANIIIIKYNASGKGEMLTLPTCPVLPASPFISQPVAHKAVYCRGSFFVIKHSYAECTVHCIILFTRLV